MPRHDQGTDNPPTSPPPIAASDQRPEGAEPRLLFWRRGAPRAAEPPPPIWELPEMPTLWTRLKQQARHQAGRWLGDRAGMRRRDETPSAANQDAGHTAPRITHRREDTASLRPPADASTSEGLDISSEVLESAYEAVRQGNISDPNTIRQLADHFARFGADDESGSNLGFDPQEAVRRLRQRAAEIAQRRGLREEEQEDPPPTQNGEGSSSGSPRRAMPRMERDENITRGG